MRRVLWGMVVVVAVAAVGGAVAFGVARIRDDGDGDICAALGAPVAGLSSFGWEDGTGRSSGTWLHVLTDGVAEASLTVRPHLALTAKSDTKGYQRVVDALPEDLTGAGVRLLQVVGAGREGFAVRTEPQIEQDVAALRALAAEQCGLT